MTKLERLEKYLASGATATPKQIQRMFGLQNPTAAIHALRSRGVCVYATKPLCRMATALLSIVLVSLLAQ